MSDPRDDPFDAVSDEDKVEEYQQMPTPEPDGERALAEPVDDPEAPLDSSGSALDDDWADASPEERPPAE